MDDHAHTGLWVVGTVVAAAVAVLLGRHLGVEQQSVVDANVHGWAASIAYMVVHRTLALAAVQLVVDMLLAGGAVLAMVSKASSYARASDGNYRVAVRGMALAVVFVCWAFAMLTSYFWEVSLLIAAAVCVMFVALRGGRRNRG